MTSTRARLDSRPFALLFTIALACGDDDTPAEGGESDGSDSGPGTTTSFTTSSTGTTSTTFGSGSDGVDDGSSASSSEGGSESETSDETGAPSKPDLGATPNAFCDSVLAQYAVIVDENAQATPDPAVIAAAYATGDGMSPTPQDFVQVYGAFLGRIDDAVLIDDEYILGALADTPTAEDLLDVESRIALVMSLVVRRRVDDVQKALPDMDTDPGVLYAQWDDAWCWWNGGLRAHAIEADDVGLEIESIEDDIVDGFGWGHCGIEGPDVPWALDPWVVPPAKQKVEKALFRVYDRLVHAYAQTAQSSDDALAARRAWGHFQLIEDRMAGKNTPGIPIIEGQLEGDPGAMDLAVITQELDVGWSKRVRTYTDQAITLMEIGTAAGFKGGWEGRTYSKVLLPRMEIALDGFDPAAHLAAWDDYLDAIATDDPVAAQSASDVLTADICAYQLALGIPECTTADTPPP